MVTDFELNALVDGQLANKERREVLAEINKSARLKTRLEELKNLKQLIQRAYGDNAPTATPANKRVSDRTRGRNVAHQRPRHLAHGS